MVIFEVYVKVHEGQREAFIAAATTNGQQAVHEPGNLRFEVYEDAEDPLRFVLFEIYRDEAALLAHTESAHFKAWRTHTAEVIEERVRKYLKPVFGPVVHK